VGVAIRVLPLGAVSRALVAPPPPVDSPTAPVPAVLSVRIPIVRPACWKDLQHVTAGRVLTFDERGWKDVMTVHGGAWANFVERQRAKLDKEISDMKRGVNGDVHVSEELSELQTLLESMADWKDLTRFSGKSITMATTLKGNEMKIHVFAFAKREDSNDIDFMRLCYKKSAEVSRARLLDESSRNPALAVALHSMMPSPSSHDEAVDNCLRLLQRPDIAKYVIALAFQGALQSEGVHLHFCDVAR